MVYTQASTGAPYHNFVAHVCTTKLNGAFGSSSPAAGRSYKACLRLSGAYVGLLWLGEWVGAV